MARRADLAAVERTALRLRSVRAEMRTFMGRPEFTPELMLDDFRQCACEWDGIDAFAAPSGTHNTAYIARDIMLGIPISGLEAHVDALFDVVGSAGQQEIFSALHTVPFGTDPGSVDRACEHVHPWLLRRKRRAVGDGSDQGHRVCERRWPDYRKGAALDMNTPQSGLISPRGRCPSTG